jgi:hypothetical protein
LSIVYCLIINWLVLASIYFGLTLVDLSSEIVPVLVANYVVAHFYVKTYKKPLDIPQAFTIGLFGVIPVVIVVAQNYNISIFSQDNIEGNLIFIGACMFLFLVNSIAVKAFTDHLDGKLKNT